MNDNWYEVKSPLVETYVKALETVLTIDELNFGNLRVDTHNELHDLVTEWLNRKGKRL